MHEEPEDELFNENMQIRIKPSKKILQIFNVLMSGRLPLQESIRLN